MVIDRLVVRVLRRTGAYRALLRWEVWKGNKVGEPELRLLGHLVDPNRSAIDVGAADGIYTFHLHRLARRCIAFEPNPVSHAELKRKLPEVEIHQLAVSVEDGHATLRIPVVKGIPYRGWGTIEPNNSLAELPVHGIQEISVRTVRPDRMELGNVGFIKIDVEGHELNVLRGLHELLVKFLPNLLIELGDEKRGGANAEVRSLLEALGYIGFFVDRDGMLKVLPKECQFAGSINAIFMPARG